MESEKLSELLQVPLNKLNCFDPTKWDLRHFDHAEFYGQWSKDRSTKIGAVIVAVDGKHSLSLGYNGFPPGVNDDIESRHERPSKYLYTEHAERNAIYTAHRNGTVILGSTIYVPLYPCADCARAIISTGIARVVTTVPYYNQAFYHRWEDAIKAAAEMFHESGVIVNYLPGKGSANDRRTEAA